MNTRSPSSLPTTRISATRRPPRPARFAAVVVEQLAHEIISGGVAGNEVLPTEPVLCEQFGFSRTVVREALKMLEERGLVVIEQGRGTTVLPRDSWNLLDPVVLRIALEYDSMSLLDDLIEVRGVLEREMTRAAAARLSEEDLAALAANVEQMAAAYADYDRVRAFDLEFHAIIMKASGNQVGPTIVHAIHRYGGATPPLSATPDAAALKRTTAQHREILAALTRRDGERASQLIAEHIELGWAQLKRSPKST
jgi:GntR family transcriptional regulator, galactonate operon transcriptional repressor